MIVMIGSRIMLWKKIAWSRSGVTPGCMSMAQSVGSPILSWAKALTPQNAVNMPVAAPATRARKP